MKSSYVMHDTIPTPPVGQASPPGPPADDEEFLFEEALARMRKGATVCPAERRPDGYFAYRAMRIVDGNRLAYDGNRLAYADSLDGVSGGIVFSLVPERVLGKWVEIREEHDHEWALQQLEAGKDVERADGQRWYASHSFDRQVFTPLDVRAKDWRLACMPVRKRGHV